MKRPVEFYGTPSASKANWRRILTEQQCPFLGRKCIKQRKSDPSQTIGACIIQHQDTPLVICPKRFLQGNQIFLDCIPLLNARGAQFYIVPEVAMPGGSIDYFVLARKGGRIVDFVGVEIQSLDTVSSGGIWGARVDLFDRRLGDTYSYGINWKMSAKTILIQLHHKAESFELLGKKFVLILQREFSDYIGRAFQAAHFRPANDADAVHFHSYDCVELNGTYRLVLAERRSTNVTGVERLLKLGTGAQILHDEVIRRIEAKMPNAVRLVV